MYWNMIHMSYSSFIYVLINYILGNQSTHRFQMFKFQVDLSLTRINLPEARMTLISDNYVYPFGLRREVSSLENTSAKSKS